MSPRRSAHSASQEVLREAVARRIAETSARLTANEIGVKSHTALAKFAEAETKNLGRKNFELVSAWFYRGKRPRPANLDAETEAAIAALRTKLADKSKPATVRELEREEIIRRIVEP